jgi:hypothetical protein
MPVTQPAWAITQAKASALCIEDEGSGSPSSSRQPQGAGVSPAGRRPGRVAPGTTAAWTSIPQKRGERLCLSKPAPRPEGRCR